MKRHAFLKRASFLKRTPLLFACVLACGLALGILPAARADTDPAKPGPYATTTQDYNFGLAAYTPPALVSATTGLPLGPNELDGRVYYPKGIDDGTSLLPAGKLPLIVFMHGRHSTSYSLTTGKTTSGWPPPAGSVQIPSYQGYDYIGTLLASYGYVVVSIGVNGINFFDNSTSDLGMLARAQTLQKNLDMWSVISSTGGPPLPGSTLDPFGTKFAGKVDMNNIGTMGHSRGGEGVMAHYVYNLAQPKPYAVKAVFAIAPVDFNRYIVNNAPIAVILPYCDGDVSDNQGTHFFDDARYNVPGDPTAKYLFTVMGADHNLFNTIWDPAFLVPASADDWLGTPGGLVDPFASPTARGNHRLNSVQQEGTGAVYMGAFFRTYLTNGTSIGGETQFLPFMKGDAPPPPSALTTELFETYHAPDLPAVRRDISRFLSTRELSTNVVGGTVTETGLFPYTLAGGAPYNVAGGPYAGPPTLALFPLPNQPGARQPGNAVSSRATNMGGLRQLEIGWSRPGAFLDNAIPAGAGDFTPFSVLTFRTALNFTDGRNFTAYDDFDVQLTDSAGKSASTPVSAWSKALSYPPGKIARLPKVGLAGVRIPLAAFQGVDLSRIVSVKYVFDRQATGAILLTGLSLSD